VTELSLPPRPVGMVANVLKPPLAEREQLRHDTDIVLGNVDSEPLDWLASPAVDLARDDLWLPHGQIKTLPPHDLHEHRELQLAAALHLPCIGSLGVANTDRDV